MSYAGVDLEVRDAIRHYVACGFEDAQNVFERITEMYDAVDEAEIDALVDAAFAARDAEAAAWPEITDCDRLDRAFAALEGAGVIARHNFACCNGCGHYEIPDEVAAAREERRTVDGYVFYHMQDTDRVVEGGELHLRYGGTINVGDETIGARIVIALRDAGLTPEWDGDPTKTIQLAIRWQRRSPPRPPVARASSDAEVARWCAALPAATLSTAAANAGDDLPLALDALGLRDAALAWSRAPFDDGDRAQALARLASARRSPELLVEAWQLAPWDRHGTFVGLLAAAGLPNEQVRRLACDKIQETRRDEYGSAAAAWLFAVAPDIEPARERALSGWAHKRDYSPDEALLALAAGLWRAGDAAMRDEVIARFSSVFCTWAQAAAVASAPTAEDLMALAESIDLALEPDFLRRRVNARLVELGEVERARSVAIERGAAAQAHVAWLTGDTATLQALAANAAEHALQYEEGIITGDELRMLRIATAVGLSDARGLAEIGAKACADALAESREAALARLAGEVPEVDRGHAAGPRAKNGPTLDAALAQWQGDIPLRRRFGARRASRTILAHASAHARRGEVARARELLAIVLAPLGTDELDDAIRRVGIEEHIIEAWIAVGDLDRVAQYMNQPYIGERVLSAYAIGCYVPALVAAGDRVRGLELFGRALDRAQTRAALLDLLPAVLALAGDAAERVHAAWRGADQVLAALTHGLDGSLQT